MCIQNNVRVPLQWVYDHCVACRQAIQCHLLHGNPGRLSRQYFTCYTTILSQTARPQMLQVMLIMHTGPFHADLTAMSPNTPLEYTSTLRHVSDGAERSLRCCMLVKPLV